MRGLIGPFVTFNSLSIVVCASLGQNVEKKVLNGINV